ncbi:hypothetical protein DYH09_28425 [bacterium CPR1]|nr:hypothetical protein [bacterium CPR1]
MAAPAAAPAIGYPAVVAGDLKLFPLLKVTRSMGASKSGFLGFAPGGGRIGPGWTAICMARAYSTVLKDFR